VKIILLVFTIHCCEQDKYILCTFVVAGFQNLKYGFYIRQGTEFNRIFNLTNELVGYTTLDLISYFLYKI